MPSLRIVPRSLGLLRAAAGGGAPAPSAIIVRVPIRPLSNRLMGRMLSLVPALRQLPPEDLAAISGQGSAQPVLDTAGLNSDGQFYTVEQNDYPVKIAGKLGQPQTWASAKVLIDTNVGRPRKPGSSQTFKKGADGNFESLYAGDVLLVPQAWRAAPAPAPAPGPTAPTIPTNPGQYDPPLPYPPAPPGPSPAPSPGPQPFPQVPPGMPGSPGMPPATPPVVTISDVQTVKQVQAHLATWNAATRAAVPADFGKYTADFDGALVPYSRTRTALASYQSWAARTKGHPLRQDGELDVPTYTSLSGTVQEILNKQGQGGSAPSPSAPASPKSSTTPLLAAAAVAAALLLK